MTKNVARYYTLDLEMHDMCNEECTPTLSTPISVGAAFDRTVG